MERLAIISKILYNQDILDKKKEIEKLKNQIEQKPHIYLNSYNEWYDKITEFESGLKIFINDNFVPDRCETHFINRGICYTQKTQLIFYLTTNLKKFWTGINDPDQILFTTKWCKKQIYQIIIILEKIIDSITKSFPVSIEQLKNIIYTWLCNYISGCKLAHYNYILRDIPFFKCVRCSKKHQIATLNVNLCSKCSRILI